jgi:hydrogenase/urease accessory protein HupE
MRGLRLLFFALVFALVASSVHAHEVRPAYLEWRQTASETYDVLWKVPARGDLRLGIYVRLPEYCEDVAPPRRSQANDAFIERRTVTCKGGLSGGRILIEGLSATLTDVMARGERLDGTTQVVRLTPSAPSFVVEAAPSWTQVAGTYLRLGVEHILRGLDHLLFVLGLLVLVGRRWRMMFKTVTAFTVAHSLTLGAATLGVVHVPAAPLNAVIALSILFMGVEIARQRRGDTSFTIEHSWGAAFGFGLLHGFGYASGLSTLGLPAQEIVVALLLFNIGVELGQLGFVALYLALWRALRTLDFSPPRWADALPAYVVGSLGAYWTMAQTAALLGVPG